MNGQGDRHPVFSEWPFCPASQSYGGVLSLLWLSKRALRRRQWPQMAIAPAGTVFSDSIGVDGPRGRWPRPQQSQPLPFYPSGPLNIRFSGVTAQVPWQANPDTFPVRLLVLRSPEICLHAPLGAGPMHTPLQAVPGVHMASQAWRKTQDTTETLQPLSPCKQNQFSLLARSEFSNFPRSPLAQSYGGFLRASLNSPLWLTHS